MLVSMHVRNFALIEKADLELGEGLNILTGETGAGKSILIDAMNVVLGGKCSAGMIRHGAESAYVELVFHITDPAQIQELEEQTGEETEDGTLILSRKILSTRSIFKLNDRTVTAARVRSLTAHLIDIHGQHEHQSLMHISKHLEILDAFAGTELANAKRELAEGYKRYTKAKLHLNDFSMKEEDRMREVDFLRFEINEIESADLKENEEEELAALYRKISNSRDLMQSAERVHSLLGYDDSNAAGNQISTALSEINSALRYDPDLKQIADQIQDLEAILSDVNHDIASYIDEITFDEETFAETANRLDEIRNLEMKYGRNFNEVMGQLEEKKKRLQDLLDYDRNRQQALEQFDEAEKNVLTLCEKVSSLRSLAKEPLVKAITESLMDLNFLQVRFDISLTRTRNFDANGYDEAEFMLSTNPGQPMLPLAQVASGGELSRIMLAVKTVLADMDRIPTLIFDEIDTGISGKTAACVSEKLSLIAGSHQVICITHLPQIASRADHHFMIEKGIEGEAARTRIKDLNEEESIEELARLLGGTELTSAALENARSLKSMAGKHEI